MEVRGNLILISSDVADSMQKLLPLKQNIFPVSFKRKVSYDGYYIKEWVDKQKVELYFDWMNKNNPLYKDFTSGGCNQELLEKFEDDLEADADVVQRMGKPQEDNQEDFNEETQDEIDALQDSNDILGQNQRPMDDATAGMQQHPTIMCNKYQEDDEAGTVANRLASLIVRLEESNHLPKEDTDEFIHDNLSCDLPDFHGDEYVEDEFVLDDEINEILQKGAQLEIEKQ